MTRYGHGKPTSRIEVVEAAHPVPDAAGALAAQRIRALLTGLRAEDLVLVLLSGGGSALLAAASLAARPVCSMAKSMTFGLWIGRWVR